MRTANRFSVKAAQKLQFSTRTNLWFSLRTNFMEQPSGIGNSAVSLAVNQLANALSYWSMWAFLLNLNESGKYDGGSYHKRELG